MNEPEAELSDRSLRAAYKCVVPWRCRSCGATGAIELEAAYPNRRERMRALLSATTREHVECPIIFVFYDFPPCWERMPEDWGGQSGE